MGHIGFPELVIIFVIALLIFGPKKLPEMGRSLGKGIREFRRATNELKSTWDEHIGDAESGLNETAKEVSDLERDLKDEFYSSRTPGVRAPETPTAREPPDPQVRESQESQAKQ